MQVSKLFLLLLLVLATVFPSVNAQSGYKSYEDSYGRLHVEGPEGRVTVSTSSTVFITNNTPNKNVEISLWTNKANYRIGESAYVSFSVTRLLR